MSSIEPNTPTPSSWPPAAQTFKSLGQKVTEGDLEAIALSEETDVSFSSDEVTALCPVTGQPDQYTVIISMQETRVTLESKSLKLYLQSFRNQGIFAEELAITIKNHILRKIGNANMSVQVKQKSRGGITLSVSTYKHKYYSDVVHGGVDENAR